MEEISVCSDLKLLVGGAPMVLPKSGHFRG